MRRVVSACLITCFVAAGAPAGAQGRPPASTSRLLTCADAIALVKQEGSVLLAPPKGPPERFVPTRDNPQCPVGYRCREPGFEEWDW